MHRAIVYNGWIDNLVFVNMNARLYDPQNGRFLAPEPIIQTPDNPQNFHRYTYCLNNPLRYIDLTGMKWISVKKGLTTFYFYDSNIQSEADVVKNYGADSGVEFIGDLDYIIYVTSSGTIWIGLYGDGSFDINNIEQTSEYDSYDIIVGSSNLIEKDGFRNFYWRYVGAWNPKQ